MGTCDSFVGMSMPVSSGAMDVSLIGKQVK